MAMNGRSIFSLAAFTMLAAGLLRGVVSTQEARNPGAAALKNPVAATPASIAAGKKAYDANCAGCHGNRAQGAVKAGIVISIIQEHGWETGARSDGRQVGSRFDRRRDLHRHQEGCSADDDGRVGGPALRHRDLEHRQLPSSARGEPECRNRVRAGRACRAGHAAQDTGARGFRPDADHRRLQRTSSHAACWRG